MTEQFISAVNAIEWDGTNLTEVESKFDIEVFTPPDGPGYNLSFAVDGDDLVGTWVTSGVIPSEVRWAIGDWVAFNPISTNEYPLLIPASDVGVFVVKVSDL